MIRFKYKLILTLLVVVLALNIFSQVSEKRELTTFTGKLKQIGDEWYINTGEDFFLLKLSPEQYLLDNDITLENKKEITVNGILVEEEIVIHNLVFDEKQVILLDAKGAPLWQEELEEFQTYKVIPDKCIGCQLCVKYCPYGAIKMVKGVAVIDPEKCIACGICTDGNKGRYKGCPTNAIKKP